jgi:hypothetical protein
LGAHFHRSVRAFPRCRGQPLGSPNNWGKNSFLRKIIKTQTNSQTVNHTSRNHGLVTGAHGPGNLSGPSSSRSRHPSGETPPHSRGPAPYYQDSASLEGWTPLGRNTASIEGWTPLGRNSASLEDCAHPRAGPRFARGSRVSTAPAPTPPTGALNALTRRGRSGQG